MYISTAQKKVFLDSSQNTGNWDFVMLYPNPPSPVTSSVIMFTTTTYYLDIQGKHVIRALAVNDLSELGKPETFFSSAGMGVSVMGVAIITVASLGHSVH